MMRNDLIKQDYWEDKYKTNQLGWDMGHVSPALKNYFDQLNNKDIAILIPGGGNAYEAEYLFKLGFKNVTVLDLVEKPLLNLKKRLHDFPSNQLVQSDFFEHSGQYDLIIEQTFFCAIDPALRDDYISKMNELLNPRGRLVGVLFNTQLENEGPPFGGSQTEYQKRFKKIFHIKTMEICYNSIKPREGRELFIIFEKIKQNYNE